MKFFFFFLSVLAAPAWAETVSVPSLKACPALLHTSQSVNGEAFFDGLPYADAALATLEGWAHCSDATVEVSSQDVVCHAFRGFIEVCAVPSDQGQFLIVKDSVDGASIQAFPASELDRLAWGTRDSFLFPDIDSCYTEILRLNQDGPGSRDHRTAWVDLDRSYTDMRWASALAARQLPAVLGLSCAMPVLRAELAKKSCVDLNGIQTCFADVGDAGFLVAARSEARRLTVGYYRWD